MTGKWRTRLFLTGSEREDVYEMIDFLLDHEKDSMEEEERHHRWAALLTKLVQGKGKNFPVTLEKNK